eukprot:jgi/Ulvmu1/9984/UM059_0033.1
MIGSMKASPATKQIGIPNNAPRLRSDTGTAQSLPSSPLSSFTERFGDKLNISSPPRRLAEATSLPSDPPRVQSPIGPLGRVTGFSVKNSPGDQGIPLFQPQPTHTTQRGLLGKAFSRETLSDQHADDSSAFQIRLRKAMSASSSGVSVDSLKWAAAKKSCDSNVLYHPLVQRAYVVATTLQTACSARQSTRLQQLEESAIIVAKLGLDATIVAATLCQDVLDCPCLTAQPLAAYLPEEVVRLIRSIRKVKNVSSLHQSYPDLQEQRNTERMCSMLLSLGDVRVLLVTFANQLEQARRMDAMDPQSRKEFILATESLYIPIANRLGVWSIKAELEDLCFKAMKPKLYSELEEDVNGILKESKFIINEFMNDVYTLLKQQGIVVDDIEGRPKSLSSIRSKHVSKSMDTSSKPLDRIHDVLAVRIIVPGKIDCYKAMKGIMDRWPSVAGRMKNYVRTPKGNGYQSLHNVVLVGDGVPIEIQIRTPQMHWNAEFGIAAHWAYKEKTGNSSKVKDAEPDGAAAALSDAWQTSWARMILQYGHEIRDYNKNVLGSRSSVLREVTQNIMSGRIDELPPRPCSDSTRRHTFDGFDLPARSRTFADHVLEVMRPQQQDNVYIIVDAEGSARIDSLKAVLGASTVGQLVDGGGMPAAVDVTQLRVNGMPVLSRAHPLYMGDVVTVLENVPALLRVPMRAIAGAPAALGSLQRELYGLVLTNMGRPCTQQGRDIAAV